MHKEMRRKGIAGKCKLKRHKPQKGETVSRDVRYRDGDSRSSDEVLEVKKREPNLFAHWKYRNRSVVIC